MKKARSFARWRFYTRARNDHNPTLKGTPMIKWNDSYSTGVSQLDEQHKTLFHYVNSLEASIEDRDVNRSVILGALDFFEQYAKMHFGTEETCMKCYRCPVAQTNILAHQRFIETYGYFRKLLSSDGATPQLFKALLSWVQEWIREHICKIDVKLKPYVKEKKK